MTTINRWIALAWAVWICTVLALALRPFLANLDIFRQVDPKVYLLMLGALGVSVPAAASYHFLRRRAFWRWEPIVLPIVFLLLCALYSPLGVVVTLWMLAAAFAAGRFATASARHPGRSRSQHARRLRHLFRAALCARHEPRLLSLGICAAVRNSSDTFLEVFW